MLAPLSRNPGVHGGGGGHCNGAPENRMKSNPALLHQMLVSVKNEAIAPYPVVV